MPLDRTPLVQAAMRLRAASPAAWEEFLQAMRHYQAQLVGQMVSVDPSMLLKAQGMAQMMTELTSTLMDAPKITEKAQEYQNGRRSHPVHS